MKIFVDSDSCPRQVRDIVSKAAGKRRIHTVFTANRQIPVAKNSFVQFYQVPQGEGEADRHILNEATPGDLVITRDIPLAADLVEKGVLVLNDRGDVYTSENIRERLSIRNVMKDIRDAGIAYERTSSFSQKEVRLFAAAFDTHVTRLMRKAD